MSARISYAKVTPAVSKWKLQLSNSTDFIESEIPGHISVRKVERIDSRLLKL